MPPPLDWLRNIDPQRAVGIVIALMVALMLFGKYLIPLLVIAAIYAILRRAWWGMAGCGGSHRVINVSSDSLNTLTAMRSKIPWIIVGVVVLLVLAKSVVIIG